MPTTNKEQPDTRLLLRVLSVVGAVFAFLMAAFFVRSAPSRSPDACVGPDGRRPTSAQCLSCHVHPHRDGAGYQIRHVAAASGTITTSSRGARMSNRDGTATDAAGNRYGVSPLEHLVWKLPAGEKSPVIVAGRMRGGRPAPGFAGDGGPAKHARLNRPSAVAVGPAGDLYIADTRNNRVRRINGDGTIETVAGNGEDGFAGDGGSARKAAVEKPLSLAFDAGGRLLIAHSNGREGRIRRVDLGTGTMETVVGGGARRAGKGDGGPARAAFLTRPVEVVYDPTSGDLTIAESRPVLRHWNIGNCALCHRLP
jgi:hypothetical protein